MDSAIIQSAPSNQAAVYPAAGHSTQPILENPQYNGPAADRVMMQVNVVGNRRPAPRKAQIPGRTGPPIMRTNTRWVSFYRPHAVIRPQTGRLSAFYPKTGNRMRLFPQLMNWSVYPAGRPAPLHGQSPIEFHVENGKKGVSGYWGLTSTQF
jgi:hypothetical protein